MAVEASGSKLSRNNNLIVAVVCLAFAAWFAYDGWLGEYKDKELAENDGQPTVNLRVNQIYGPVGLSIVAIYFLYGALRLPSRRIVADDRIILIDGQREIAYGAIEFIDHRKFDKEGHFTVGYSDAGQSKQMKFSSRKYDNLSSLLAEIVKQTGAKPERADETSEPS